MKQLLLLKRTLSTFSLVLAEVSTYGTPHCWARPWHSANGTFRLSFRSHLLPTSKNGMLSSFLTRRICSLQSNNQSLSIYCRNKMKVFRITPWFSETLTLIGNFHRLWSKIRTEILLHYGNNCHVWQRNLLVQLYRGYLFEPLRHLIRPSDKRIAPTINLANKFCNAVNTIRWQTILILTAD